MDDLAPIRSLIVANESTLSYVDYLLRDAAPVVNEEWVQSQEFRKNEQLASLSRKAAGCEASLQYTCSIMKECSQSDE